MDSTQIPLKVSVPSAREVRRFLIPNESTFSDLINRLEIFFLQALPPEYELTYVDPEQDQVSFATDAEWQEAKRIHTGRLIRLTVVEKKTEPTPTPTTTTAPSPVPSSSSEPRSKSPTELFLLQHPALCRLLQRVTSRCSPSNWMCSRSCPPPPPSTSTSSSSGRRLGSATEPSSSSWWQQTSGITLEVMPDGSVASAPVSLDAPTTTASSSSSSSLSPPSPASPTTPAVGFSESPAENQNEGTSAPVAEESNPMLESMTDSWVIVDEEREKASALPSQMSPRTMSVSVTLPSTTEEMPMSMTSSASFSVSPDLPVAKFVADVQIKDGDRIPCGSEFEKMWRIGNPRESVRDWPTNCYLKYVGGDLMDGMNGIHIICPRGLAPREVADFAIRLQAPVEPGTYKSYFRLHTPAGQEFGRRMGLHIVAFQPDEENVQSPALAEPVAPAAAAPLVLPSDVPAPVDEEAPYQYASQIRSLADMGFRDSALLRSWLNQNNGVLEQTIAALFDHVAAGGEM